MEGHDTARCATLRLVSRPKGLQMSEPAIHSPTHPDNQHFVEFARRQLGSRLRIDNFSRDFGRPSIVWRLTGSDGSRAWLKHHEGRSLYERELLGLQRLV